VDGWWPAPLFWPMFVVATAAAIIASQAMISATYSIIDQSIALSCFPRLKVIHTSEKYHGQIYVPEINYILMVITIVICIAFKGSTSLIGNAYGDFFHPFYISPSMGLCKSVTTYKLPNMSIC
jgi:KUP system potassium uptake protein